MQARSFHLPKFSVTTATLFLAQYSHFLVMGDTVFCQLYAGKKSSKRVLQNPVCYKTYLRMLQKHMHTSQNIPACYTNICTRYINIPPHGQTAAHKQRHRRSAPGYQGTHRAQPLSRVTPTRTNGTSIKQPRAQLLGPLFPTKSSSRTEQRGLAAQAPAVL